jgi:hypothetical protein
MRRDTQIKSVISWILHMMIKGHERRILRYDSGCKSKSLSGWESENSFMSSFVLYGWNYTPMRGNP